LHTDYDSEIQYKLAALQRQLRGLPLDPQQIDTERAPERLGYRNRIQLHYRHKTIGMVDGSNNRIIEVPHCKIIGQQLQPALDALYADKSWSEAHPGSGHCEFYYKEGELRSSWNQPYADGGFTQVNDAMNAALRTRLVDYAAKGPANTVLDLFAGQGNLSEPLLANEGVRRVMVEQAGDRRQLDQVGFYKLDLFDPSALATLLRREATKAFDLMIVDPPRKGFAALAQWVRKYQPRQLIYVSCNAATMARDLKTLQGKYTVSDICMMDLFPATYHFETLVRIEFKNHHKK
jgi:23S rRNA (uracil1939-C5)-methyltransferase